MKKWLNKNLNSVIIGSFLIPILLVAFVSISHVTTFYKLSNPFVWAIYLSVAVEVAALAALAGVSAKFGKFIYIPFGIVTLIQFIGNFFFSYTWININSKEFKDWVDMVGAILEPMGIDSTDLSSQRRVLGFLTGGLLPFISLTFAHMLIVYSNKIKDEVVEKIDDGQIENNNRSKKNKQNKDLVKVEDLTEKDIERISKRTAKKEKERMDKEKPYVPSQEDLEKLKNIMEKQFGFIESKNENQEIKVEDNTPQVTPEPSYFVDDEPVMDEENKSNRLVYSKDEG
jgi:hypothetical protein